MLVVVIVIGIQPLTGQRGDNDNDNDNDNESHREACPYRNLGTWLVDLAARINRDSIVVASFSSIRPIPHARETPSRYLAQIKGASHAPDSQVDHRPARTA